MYEWGRKMSGDRKEKRFTFQFNSQDDELYAWFVAQPNKGAYLKTLIRQDMALRKKKNLPLAVVTRKDRLDESWEENLALLKEFIEKHARIPFYYEKYNGVNLGRWLQTSMNRYQENRPDRIEALKEVCEFDKWERYYQATVNFYNANGRLPIQEETYNDLLVGQWVFRQRAKLRKQVETLRKDQIDKLNKLFIYKTTWETSYYLVVKFKEENGYLPKYSDRYNNYAIGRWLAEQRAKIDSNTNTEQVQMLTSLGLLAPPWEERYLILKKFIQEFNRLPHPEECYLNVFIGKWLTKQCTNNVLVQHPEYIEPLKAVGVLPHNITFDDIKKGSVDNSQGNIQEYRTELKKLSNLERWEQHYQMTVEFFRTYERLPKRKEKYQGLLVGEWVFKQRAELREKDGVSSLKKEQLKKLKEIYIYKPTWETKYQLVVKFKEEYGRLPKYDEKYGSYSIGRWLADQMRDISSMKDPEQTQMLADLES